MARTPAIAEAAAIPRVGDLPTGFFIAALMAFLTWYLLFRTTLGYEIRTVGLNSHAANYAGIKVARIIILTMAISGFLAGMGGAIETLGVVGRFQPGLNTGLGFDGITIALLAHTNPLGVIPEALLFGVAAQVCGGLALPIGVHAGINLARWAIGETETPGFWVVVHVSASIDRRDAHAPVSKDTWGLDWARARLRSGTPVVLECYMHHLDEDARRRQIAEVLR